MPEAAWADAAHWTEEALGLHFPERLWPTLQQGFAAAATRLGLPDGQACVELALAGALQPPQEQVLVEALTIGETYFFRDPAVFEGLAREMLAPLLERRRRGSRHLRLWSAGCASGEEAWSLAMLVARLLPDWRDWNISILATDVSEAALQKGRAASYGRWSLRASVPPAYRCFLREGADGRRQIDPALRPMVQFARLNLATDAYPSAATHTGDMDLILCRNVLIYFEPVRARAVLAQLGRCLAGDGWLVTGAAELPTGGVEGLRIEQAGPFFVLRPVLAARAVAATRPPGAQAAPRPETARLPAARASEPPAIASAQVATAAALDHARQLADSGDLAGAEHLCRAAVARDKLDPAATWLLASILTEAGASADAAAALRRTLYLDPGHVLARFALGSLALAQGQGPAGRRHLERALAQLATVPANAVLPGSGGLTARELEGAIRRMEAAL